MELENILEICNKRNKSLISDSQLEEFVENNIRKEVSAGELYVITTAYEFFVYNMSDFELCKFVTKEILSYLYLIGLDVATLTNKSQEELIIIFDELYKSGIFEIIENKNKKYVNLIKGYLKEHENSLIVKTMLDFEIPSLDKETIDNIMDKDKMDSFARMINFLHPEQLNSANVLSEVLKEGLDDGRLNEKSFKKIIETLS